MNNNDSNKPLIAGTDSAISVKELHNAVDNHTDSHDMVSNTTNNNTVNQNSTIVYNGTAATQKLSSELKESYLRFCQKNIVSPVISRQTRLELDEEAIRLQLDKSVAEEVEQTVIRRLNSSGKLSQNDRITLSIAIDKIKEDSAADMLDKLAIIADKSEDEEVQFYANLSLAAYDFRRCIRRYEQRTFDSYWQAFWTYFAYKRVGNSDKAEAVLSHLSNWSDYPDDQVTLLSGSGYLLDYFANNGAASLKTTADGYIRKFVSYSPLLSDYRAALSYLLTSSRPLYFNGEKRLNIYLRLFGATSRQNVISNSKPVSFNNDTVALNSKPAPAASPASTNYSSANYTQPKYSEDNSDKKNWIKYAIFGLIAIGILYFVFKPSKNDYADDNLNQELTGITEGPTEGPEVQTEPEQDGTTVRNEEKSTISKEPEQITTVNGPKGQDFGGSQETTGQPKPGGITDTPEDPKPQKSMLDQLQEAYNQGSTEAAVKLGIMYLDGDEVKKSKKTAFQYFKYAADKGNAEGMYWVGDCYRNGNGVSKDMDQAKYWWQKAADAGNSKAKEAVKEFKTLM